MYDINMALWIRSSIGELVSDVDFSRMPYKPKRMTYIPSESMEILKIVKEEKEKFFPNDDYLLIYLDKDKRITDMKWL